MTTPANGSIDQMFAQATGQPATAPATSPASSGPATISIGNDSPDSSTGTGQGQPAAPASPAAGSQQSIDQMFAQATGQPDTGTSSDHGATPPASGGFVQGLGEGSGLGGVGSAVKAAVADNQQKGQRALDLYHQMVAAHAAGQHKEAADLAGEFLLTTSGQGLQKAYAPFIEAAKMVIMDPVKAIQEQRAINQKVQADQKAGVANPNTMKAVWDRAKQDWKNNNPDAALTDVLAGTVGQPGMGGIPLVGPMVSSMANNLNEATHAPGGEDVGRVLGNTVGALGMAAAGEAVGALGKALPGAGGDVAAGLAEGQAGSDAAQTAADTAKAHDSILQKNKDTFKSQLDQATQAAQDKAAQATEANKANTVETGNQNAEQTTAHKADVESTRDAQHQAVDDTLAQEKQTYADQFQQSLQTHTTGAAAPEDLAPKVNEGIDAYEKKSHEDFEEGMNGEGGVIEQLDGHTEPVIGSPLQEKAAQLLKKPTPGDHPLTLGAKNLAGVKLDGNVQKWLQNASEGMQDVEVPGPADEAGNATTQIVKKPMADLTADQLVGIRQNLREAATQFQRGDLNRRVIGDLINATDKTLEKLATAADNPDVLSQYEGLRKNYKTARANLDTSAADKLRLDSPDKAMGDVNKYLLQGNNAAAKISTMSSILGDETMQGLRQSYIQQLSEMAPADAIKALGKIPDNVKQAFFGPELDGRLAASKSLYEKSVSSAEEAAASAKKNITDTADTRIGDASLQAKYDRQAVSAASQKETARIADEYSAAAKTAKDLHDTQSAPYSTGFTKAISDGSIGSKLAADKIATEDIAALKQALDPADFAKIQQGIVNRQMAATTVEGHFNPAKFMDWYDKIPEPARNEFFSDAAGTPMKLDLSSIRSAAAQQKLVRAGLLTMGGGALTVVPHTALAGLLEVAAGAAAATKGELIANLLDTVATNPRLLTNLSKVMPAVKATAKAVRDTARTATAVGPVLGPSFGQQVTVDGQPGTQVGMHPESKKPVIMYHPNGAQ